MLCHYLGNPFLFFTTMSTMSSYRRWTRDQEVLPILLSLFAFHTNPVSRTLTDYPMAWSVLRMMQTPDSIPSLIPPTTPNMSVHLERPMVPSYRQPPLIFQRHAAPVVAEPPVRNPVPHFCLAQYHPQIADRPSHSTSIRSSGIFRR